MTPNMGTIDRGIRITLAVAVPVLYFTGAIRGAVAVIFWIFAVVFAVTSLVGWCPAYAPFGLSTRKRPSARSSVV